MSSLSFGWPVIVIIRIYLVSHPDHLMTVFVDGQLIIRRAVIIRAIIGWIWTENYMAFGFGVFSQIHE